MWYNKRLEANERGVDSIAMNDDEWVIVRRFPAYEIRRDGSVRNVKSGRLLKTFIHNDKYWVVGLRAPNPRVQKVHRLLWEAFRSAIPEGMQINHIDGVKSNNDLSNLELVTPKQNTEHAIAMGLRRWNPETHRRAKLTEQEVTDIRTAAIGMPRTTNGCRRGSGEIKALAEKYKVGRSRISAILAGRSWKDVA